ncbi:MAG: hypothetical protein OXC82_05245 [Rhodobacteraceae bacterium]|nr:hypothetical protein [Paracoccaceae bacterium]MCY4249828.1 hypothetical protein [Paracoccaceae bacterium]MCY4307115.1 hypothetical protein [Paracoccaceae bacterium]
MKIVTDSGKRGMGIGQDTPLASGAKKVLHGIDKPTQIGLMGPSHMPLLRQQGLNQLPFAINQVVLHVIVYSPVFFQATLLQFMVFLHIQG